MEKNYKKTIQTYAETLFATAVCALGVCLFVHAGLGCDTIDVLLEGAHRSFHITLGQADQIYAVLFFLLALLLNRRFVGIPSIVYTLSVGLLIDLFDLWLLPLKLSTHPYVLRLLYVVIGEFCFALSYAIFQTIEKGMNTVDAVVYYFVERTGLSYTWIRTIFDGLFFVIGIFLGGTFGIGTIFYVLSNGRMIPWCRRLVERVKGGQTRDVNGVCA